MVYSSVRNGHFLEANLKTSGGKTPFTPSRIFSVSLPSGAIVTKAGIIYPFFPRIRMSDSHNDWPGQPSLEAGVVT